MDPPGLDPGVNCEVEHHVEADTTMIALGNVDRGAGTAADVVAVEQGLPSGAPVAQDEPVPHDAPAPAEEDTPLSIHTDPSDVVPTSLSPPVRSDAPGSWGPNAIHQLVAPHAWRLPFERAWRDH